MRLLPALPLLILATGVCAGDFLIDPARTTVEFAITALGLIEQDGRFGRVRGRVSLDEARGAGEMHIEIDADSIDTGLTLRDQDFRSERWFDTARYPTLVFRGRRFIYVDSRLDAIDGDLEMKGVRRPLRFRVERFACGPRADGRQVCTARASATLRRSQYGMDSYSLLVGDEVRLQVGVEAASSATQ